MQDPWFDMYEGPKDMDRTLEISIVVEKSIRLQEASDQPFERKSNTILQMGAWGHLSHQKEGILGMREGTE